ncbi:PucR family transcriptional regulator [Microbacterium marinilacus]|uniref:PucR family transcriptional regulator n=1 Tax=Microbacterium marinilacus TaxID=415209 RepID=UPI001C8E4E8F|nr:PucR family transcriptional regulator [Microbacterium marinilacus]MBY0690273.1 helix-turn-helix domain-containing protein [Microbacterium marinilacus]
MPQSDLRELLDAAKHLGLTLRAGPYVGPAVQRVVISPIDALSAAPGSLVLATTREGNAPSPYQVDVAIRQAIARGFSGLVFIGELVLAETARALAERAGMRVLTCTTGSPPDIAMGIDRIVRGDAVGALARAEYAIDRAGAVAEQGHDAERILAEASEALGLTLSIEPGAGTRWTDPDAVCVGETPVGRLRAEGTDAAVALAVPVIASLVSRAMQRDLSERFAPTQSRADLIVELILADSSRVDAFAADAARLGLPLQLSHAVGWLRVTHRDDPAQRPPRTMSAALELFALQLVEPRSELWHFASMHDDLVVVSSEPLGAGDHQRRLREVGGQLIHHVSELGGQEWVCTLGLGTPQLGASGLRQSAAEARITVETAIAGGRSGSIAATDVTGLRRVLLDFYASPLSRKLLDDVLAPLDALGPERADVAVRTLQAYLANRNSLARAAEVLNLHPNAVNYRVRRAEQALQLDLSDPDHRFAVELACRVRLLSTRR